MTDFVPFDRDWHAIGFLEPEFHEETLGWANEEILFDAGMIPVKAWSQQEPVCWVPGAFTKRPLPEPKRIKQTVLRWRWVGDAPRTVGRRCHAT